MGADESVKQETLRGKIDVVIEDDLIVAAGVLNDVEDTGPLLRPHARRAGDFILQLADTLRMQKEQQKLAARLGTTPE